MRNVKFELFFVLDGAFHYQRAIDSYADAANVDIDQLGNAYAGLDFFFNTRIRNT